MPLARVSAPTRLRSAWAGRPRPHSSPNSARHVPCLSFSLLERGAPNLEAQLRPTRCPEAERAHPAGTPAPQSRVTAPYLRSGPRRPPPGRPGDPRPARVPPVPPASRRWVALRARGPRWGASARRVGKWGGGWRAGRRPPPPAPARRLPLQLLPLARARARLGRGRWAHSLSPDSESLLCTLAHFWTTTRGEVRWGNRCPEKGRPSGWVSQGASQMRD